MMRGRFVNCLNRRPGGGPVGDLAARASRCVHGIASRGMVRVGIVLAIVFGLAVLGGCLFLAFGDFSAPSRPVEKVLPDARFPK